MDFATLPPCGDVHELDPDPCVSKRPKFRDSSVLLFLDLSSLIPQPAPQVQRSNLLLRSRWEPTQTAP